MEPIFDHEKLDVYGVELQFMTWITDFLHDVCGSPVQHRRELIEQLDRASLSMLLNTAEGNSKRHGRHRAKLALPLFSFSSFARVLFPSSSFVLGWQSSRFARTEEGKQRKQVS
jgi:hypothetical protein